MHGYDKWEKESLKNEEQPLLPYNTTESRVLKKYLGRQTAEKEPEIRFSGRLLGGCMDCLVNLLGTRFDKTQDFLEKYKEDGIIWFLEACDLNVFASAEPCGRWRKPDGFSMSKVFSSEDRCVSDRR